MCDGALAGTKKVQQDLATPGVLERFLPPVRAAVGVRQLLPCAH